MPDTLHPPAERCSCRCHEGSVSDRWRADGVSLYDIVEAAVACHRCRGKHAVALLSMRPANAPAPRVVEPYIEPDPPKKPEGEDGG